MVKQDARPLIFRPLAPLHRVDPAGAPDSGASGVLSWFTRTRLEVHVDVARGEVSVHAMRVLGAGHVLARYFTRELAAVALRVEHLPDAAGGTTPGAALLLLPADADEPPIELGTGLAPDEALAEARALCDLLDLPLDAPPEWAHAV